MSAAWLLLAAPLVLLLDQKVESQASGDFDGDGVADDAYVAAAGESRQLVALRAVAGQRTVGVMELDSHAQAPASLRIAKGVLIVEELTGGTTALATTWRFRYDAKRQRMRLIGLDATHYSRTFAHDGFEFSWNLLTGALITRELHLNANGGDAAFDRILERRSRRRSPPLMMEDAPDAETLMEQLQRRQ